MATIKGFSDYWFKNGNKTLDSMVEEFKAYGGIGSYIETDEWTLEELGEAQTDKGDTMTFYRCDETGDVIPAQVERNGAGEVTTIHLPADWQTSFNHQAFDIVLPVDE